MNIMINSLFSLTIFRFSTTFVSNAFRGIILPVMILFYVPETEKGKYLASIITPAAIFAFILFLISGSISDIITSKFGRRKPFLLISSIVMIISILYALYSDNLYDLYPISILLLSATSVGAATHVPLIPDILPPQKRSKATALLSLFNFLGTSLGIIFSGILLSIKITPSNPILKIFSIPPENNKLFIIFLLMITIVIICAFFNIFFVKETIQINAEKHLFIEKLRNLLKLDIKKNKKVFWLMLSRYFAFISIVSLPLFIYYFQKDFIKSENPALGTSITLGCTVTGGVIILVFQKIILSNLNYIKTLYLCKVIMILSIAGIYCLTFIHKIFFYICSFIFGTGFGLFFSVILAYLTLIIPDKKKSGQIISLFVSTTFLSSVTGTSIGGLLLDYFNMVGDNYGYLALILFFIISIFISFFFLGKVKNLEEKYS